MLPSLDLPGAGVFCAFLERSPRVCSSLEAVLNTNEIGMISALKELKNSLGRCLESKLYKTRKYK